MKISSLLLTALLALSLASCRQKAQAAHATPAVKTEPQPVDPTQALNLKPTPEQIAQAKVLQNIHCPTDGEKIGSMGKAVPVIYKGRVVQLCCAGCPKEFANDPDKYLLVALADTLAAK